MANTNEIPPDAEKLLFAADVVQFFLNDRYPNSSSEFGKTEVGGKVDYYREHVQKRFSENIKKMIAVIDETQSVLVRRDFLDMKNQNTINVSTLMEYNILFKDCHFAKGFQARNFLMYCARIAVMACNFFSHGVKDSLDIAIDLIKSAFTDDKNEASFTWESLENAASKYANIKSDFSGSAASFLFRREPADLISSETEESSNSSTINSESDSVAEMPDMTPASSAESLSAAVTKLNVSNTESPDYVQSEDGATASGNLQSNVIESSSTSTILAFTISDIERSIRNAFLKVESTSEQPPPSAPALPLASAAPPPALPLASAAPPALPPASPSSSVDISVKSSNYKSCLGKRPSPRKEQDHCGAALNKEPSEAAGDDSETEIKKRKLCLPEADKH